MIYASSFTHKTDDRCKRKVTKLNKSHGIFCLVKFIASYMFTEQGLKSLFIKLIANWMTAYIVQLYNLFYCCCRTSSKRVGGGPK